MNKQYSFSPYNPETRRLWPHILAAFISPASINRDNIDNHYIRREGVVYTLIVNATLSRVAAKIEADQNITLPISFQKHMDEWVAVPDTSMLGDL